MKFLEDLTQEEKEQCFSRLLPNQYHDEDNNIIISREQYNREEFEIMENYKVRILKENMNLYNKGKSVANEPKKFAGCSINDYLNTEKYDSSFVSRMMSRAVAGDSFYIMGEFGSGKTRFMWAYMKYLYLAVGKRDIQIVHFQDLFNGLKMEYGTRIHSDIYNKALTVNTLLIDDIRRFNPKKLEEYDSFVRLLDSRIENDLTTCFTSNMSFKKLVSDDEKAPENRRLTTRFTRILKSKKNLEMFKKEFNTF